MSDWIPAGERERMSWTADERRFRAHAAEADRRIAQLEYENGKLRTEVGLARGRYEWLVRRTEREHDPKPLEP